MILVLVMEKSTLINGEALGASLEVTLVIEQFLNETYRFRRNILNGKVEFAILPKADETAEGNTAGCSSSLSSGCLFNSVLKKLAEVLVDGLSKLSLPH